MAQITPVQNEYLYGKGSVVICERDGNGGISEAVYVGNCPELKINSSAEKLTHFESESGRNSQDRELIKTLSAEFSVSFESISRRNLALMFWGSIEQIAEAAAQSSFFPIGIANGDTHVIPNAFNISDLVIKDSAGVPVTVPNTKYNWDDDFGVVEFLDVAGYTQPFEAEFNRGAAESVPLLTQARPARFLRFHGINLGNPGEANDKFMVELYQCAFDTPEEFSLIGDDFASFVLKGSLQVDETRKADSALGGYGRIIKMGAAYTP